MNTVEGECCELEQESVDPNDTWTHSTCVLLYTEEKTHQQLFEFHLKFVSHPTYLSENIYLSHIGPFIHKVWVRVWERVFVCLYVRRRINCNGYVNYFVCVWQLNCCWLQHTWNAWLKLAWIDGMIHEMWWWWCSTICLWGMNAQAKFTWERWKWRKTRRYNWMKPFNWVAS